MEKIDILKKGVKDCARCKENTTFDEFENVRKTLNEIYLKKRKIIGDFERIFCEVKSIYDSFANRIDEYIEHESPDFNIFKILHIEHYEVLTHSNFLVNLLSPDGSHGQRNLFLRSFLVDVIGISRSIVDHKLWIVEKEKENIDIRIINNALDVGIFIENKIYTDAHSGQLSRYFKLWKDQYRKGGFAYLTINGSKPSIFGYDDTIYPREIIEKELILLSYKYDILCWLKNIFPAVKSKKVQYTISQYLDVLRTL